MKSYAKLFDESREAVLDLVASGVEAYYRQRSALEKALPEVPVEEEANEGDFLHDFVNLNVQYLNQLARLGSSYSILGARALERIYEWVQPPAPDNRLSGSAGSKVEFSFMVRNSTSSRQTLSWRVQPFSDGGRSVRLVHELELCERGKKSAPLGRSKDLEPQKSYELTIRLTLSPQLRPGVDYTGSVIVRLAGDETEHSIVVRRVPR